MSGVDQYRSIELNLAILEVAKTFLKEKGSLILKVFVGEDIHDLMQPLKQHFKKVSRFKPKACRDRSFEEYFICQEKFSHQQFLDEK
jgi:23S rRNA (uridine2552-2'-O)-methyltransferase